MPRPPNQFDDPSEREKFLEQVRAIDSGATYSTADDVKSVAPMTEVNPEFDYQGMTDPKIVINEVLQALQETLGGFPPGEPLELFPMVFGTNGSTALLQTDIQDMPRELIVSSCVQKLIEVTRSIREIGRKEPAAPLKQMTKLISESAHESREFQMAHLEPWWQEWINETDPREKYQRAIALAINVIARHTEDTVIWAQPVTGHRGPEDELRRGLMLIYYHPDKGFQTIGTSFTWENGELVGEEPQPFETDANLGRMVWAAYHDKSEKVATNLTRLLGVGIKIGLIDRVDNE